MNGFLLYFFFHGVLCFITKEKHHVLHQEPLRSGPAVKDEEETMMALLTATKSNCTKTEDCNNTMPYCVKNKCEECKRDQHCKEKQNATATNCVANKCEADSTTTTTTTGSEVGTTTATTTRIPGLNNVTLAIANDILQLALKWGGVEYAESVIEGFRAQLNTTSHQST